jgi:hypothetical protein
MKAVKWIVIAAVVYVGIVVLFESLIGYFQPPNEDTLVIRTLGADGEASDRVVSRLESDGKLYVAVNHWPRAWYHRALENPNVEVTLDGPKAPYLAVPVTGAEHDRVNSEHALPIPVRFLTGFPPRYLVRLDPR